MQDVSRGVLDDAFLAELFADAEPSPRGNPRLPDLHACGDVVYDPFLDPPAPFCADRALFPCVGSPEFLSTFPQDADKVAARVFSR